MSFRSIFILQVFPETHTWIRFPLSLESWLMRLSRNAFQTEGTCFTYASIPHRGEIFAHDFRVESAIIDS